MLKIGEFARLGRVSVKALRYYEEEGLLAPRFVDPGSGYRYYEIGQCDRLALIGNLRAAGFPIAEIASILNAGAESVLDVVNDQREKLLAEQAEIDNKLETLKALAKSAQSAESDAISAVRIASLPEQLVYRVAATVPRLGDPVAEIFENAEARVSAAAARADASPFTIFVDPPHKAKDIALEVCIPLVPNARDIEQTKIPACGRACSVVYMGSYTRTDDLLHQVTAWATDAGLEPCGHMREIYHRFGADQDQYELPRSVIAAGRDEFITEILLPVRSSAEDNN